MEEKKRKSIPNKEYWKKRALEIESQTQEKIDKTDKKIKSILKDSEEKTKKDIAVLYAKFAKDNKLNSKEAKKHLDSKEFKDWRMSLDEYVREYKTTGNKDLWLEIETITMRKRITRLESLQAKIKAETLKNGYFIDEQVKESMGEIYKDSFKTNLYNIQKGTNLYYGFEDVDIEKMKEVLKFKNSGKNFSDRIYESTQRVATRINKDLAQAFSTSIDYKKITENIKKDFRITTNEAKRLVRTEANFYMNQGNLKSYKEAEIQGYIYEAMLDKKTSEICRKLDQKRFLIKDVVIGENYPTMHPNCRSTTVPDLDVAYEERIARNKDNVFVSVKGDMNYKEWEKFIEKGEQTKFIKPLEKEKVPVPEKEIIKPVENIVYAKKEFDIYSDSLDELNEIKNLENDIIYRTNEIKQIRAKIDKLNRQKNNEELGSKKAEKKSQEIKELFDVDSQKISEIKILFEKRKTMRDTETVVKEVLNKQNIYQKQIEKEIIKNHNLKDYDSIIKYCKDNNIKVMNTVSESKKYNSSLTEGHYIKKEFVDKETEERKKKIQMILITMNENKDFKKVYDKVGLPILVSGEFRDSAMGTGGYYISYKNKKVLDGVMVLNTGEYSDLKKEKLNSYESLYNFGRNNIGFNFKTTFIHEYGHRVDHILKSKDIEIYDEFMKKVNKDKNKFDVSRNVSVYASKNSAETVAEIFSVVFSENYIPEKFPPEFKIFKDLVMEKMEEI
ncbi:MAG: minor capsid protein [Cetobacterium sp.]